MNETNITRSIMLALGKLPYLRLFRNNVGTGWVGVFSRLKNGDIVIKDARPLHSGLCQGSSDLIGWKTIEITPDMVGKQAAIFVAIEVKTEKGRPTAPQINFIENVNRAGGIGFIARDINEAIRGVNNIR